MHRNATSTSTSAATIWTLCVRYFLCDCFPRLNTRESYKEEGLHQKQLARRLKGTLEYIKYVSNAAKARDSLEKSDTEVMMMQRSDLSIKWKPVLISQKGKPSFKKLELVDIFA